MDVAELLRQARERHGLSQRELAARAATDQAAVSRIERGEVSPRVETVERLLAAMGERLWLGLAPLADDDERLDLRAGLARTAPERARIQDLASRA
jgi:transcriptional regulator with XRE-family HTH domain